MPDAVSELDVPVLDAPIPAVEADVLPVSVVLVPVLAALPVVALLVLLVCMPFGAAKEPDQLAAASTDP